MPGPLDILKKAGQWATRPLVGQETVAPIQDAIDSPTLDRSPGEARMRGFASGALEGLRGMTSPLSLAGMASPALGALGKLGRAGNTISKVGRPTLDLVENAPIKQVAPALDDVDTLIGDLQRNLARVPSKRPAPMETLGEVNPEFTAIGGEGMYNMGNNATGPVSSGAFEELIRNLGGRGR